MAWIHGTCAGHLELLDVLKNFLTTNAELVAAGQNWSVNKDQTIPSYNTKISGTYGTSFRELYLQGPGLAGADAICVSIRAFDAPTYGAYNWLINGHVSYDPVALFEDQPGTCVNGSGLMNNFFVTLTSATIEYWMVANGRRFIVIAKINGNFYAFYAGLILPYALPTEFPYPLFVSGNHSSYYTLPSATTPTNWWAFSTNGMSGIRDPAGTWLALYPPPQSLSTSYIGIWPESQGTSPYGFPEGLVGNPDGLFPLLPQILYTAYGSKACYGELDGSFCVPGLSIVPPNISSEDTITIGSDTYLIVQNCDKTARSSYAAIKLA